MSTYPGPLTLATEVAVKEARSIVHDAGVEVAMEFERLERRRDDRIPSDLRALLVKLVAALDAEAAACTEHDRASDAEWEAFSNPEPEPEARP